MQAVRDAGISSVAVVLKHAYIFGEHEEAVGKLAQELGFKQISLSAVVMPMVKMVPRGFTAAADAYLTPHILRYLLILERCVTNCGSSAFAWKLCHVSVHSTH